MPKSCKKFARWCAEQARLGTNLAEHGDRQHTARSKPLNHLFDQILTSEEVAEKYVNEWAIGQANIEIYNVEPTLRLNFVMVGQPVGASNRNGRDVYSPNGEPAAGKPHRAAAGTARNIKRCANSREVMLCSTERIGRIIGIG